MFTNRCQRDSALRLPFATLRRLHEATGARTDAVRARGIAAHQKNGNGKPQDMPFGTVRRLPSALQLPFATLRQLHEATGAKAPPPT